MDRKSGSTDTTGGGGGGGGKKSSSGGSASAGNTNNQIPHGLTAEPNLAELFAAHNLLASSGMGGPGSNPLALLQQQMNMQYASPAAWWYLEYLSRIQAAQMAPNLQTGASATPGNMETRDREHESRTPTHRGGRQSGEGESRRKSGKQSSQAQSDAGSTHPSLSLPSSQRNSQSTSRRNDRDGHTTARTTSRRGRGASSAAAAAAAAIAANSYSQIPPVQLLSAKNSRATSAQAPPVPIPNSNSRVDHQQALNLSKSNLKQPQNSNCGPEGTGESSSNKSLNLPSSVTIIPHAHSKPDSLTCPRFPSDYVPKPAHMSNPSLYSHTVPKSPQLGLVKGEKVKRKSTVASLLQQSRAASGASLSGNVEILPKSDRSSDHPPQRNIRSGDKNQGDHHHTNEKTSKAEKASASAAGSRTSDRNASPLLMQQGQMLSQRSTPEKVVPTSSTPPHRPWLNTAELNIPQPKPKAEPDLNAPLQNGWRRETLLKGLSSHGLNGEVSYISPNNVTVKSMQELKKVVGNNGLKNYSFSCKLLIGDFLLPGEDGTVLKLTSNELANWLKEEAKQNKKEEERVKTERERKKEHAGLVRALELFRRARRRHKLQQERKLKKRAENTQEEVKSEPVEVDEVMWEKKLNDLGPIKGLRLSPQAFANMLHIYEFLHTFGNTLGFDMDSLPSLSSLQKALLHIDENEEELLSVLSHLLVCAVEDPGMPNPNKHMTSFGQTLKQADITFGGLSEVLRLYLQAVCDSEPEASKFSEWLEEAPFLALSPTRKSSIISFICDLLLQNKAVLKHLETSTETAHSTRKERQQNEIKLRRLRVLCARKTVAAVAAESERVDDDHEDEEMKVVVKNEIPESSSIESEKPMSNDTESKPQYSNGTVVKEVDVDVKEEVVIGSQILKEKEFVKSEHPISKPTNDIFDEIKAKIENEENAGLLAETSIDTTDSISAKNVKGKPMDVCHENSVGRSVHDNSHTSNDCKNISNVSVTEPDDVKMDLKILPLPPDDDASFLSSSSSSEDSDSDAKLSVDEIRLKMNSLQRSSDKLKHQQGISTRVIRSTCLGQDRYRRRYWNLPAAGGIYVEGGASGEFDELKIRVGQRFAAVEAGIPETVVKKEEEKPMEVEDVPPPCLKIFSFVPREGCSGRIKDVPVKAEEEKREDDTLISVIEPKQWDSWWKLDGNITEFVQDFCSTGVREPALKIALSSLTTPPTLVEDELEDDEIPANVHSPPNGWDPELAYKVHLQLLETMETLEERVASASLQVKGWQVPARPAQDLSENDIIELVKDRLLGLENGIERRYLKPPLGKSANELNLLANVAEGGTDIYVGPKALMIWREAISRATTPAVLSMAVHSLDTSIAWDKSVMKASCQLCKGGDHEDKLLLCDACDRGYHTYCFKPPLETIPDGDWFCWECINKATGTKGCIVCGKGAEHGKIISCDKCANKAYHLDCIHPPLGKVPRGRWYCPDHKTPTKKRKSESGDGNVPGPSKKSTKKTKSEIVWCEKLLDDLCKHEDAWPFLEPVNTRQFPTYKKIIKNPMDLASIRAKMSTYKTKADFLGDIRLIFDNCFTFNEDDSPVGKAGHSLRLFFEAASNRT